MKDKLTSIDYEGFSLLFPPSGIFWLWMLLWFTGGAILGGMTSNSLYESIIYGDYGGGAWIGGLAFYLLLCGGFAGLMLGIVACAYEDSLWIGVFRIFGGLFLGGAGSFSSFIMIALLMRILFERADKYITRASMTNFVIISGLLMGAITGAVLGFLQVFLQEMLTRKRGRREKNNG